MKPVVLTLKYRFTKSELIDLLLIQFESVTTRKELNRLVNRNHVLDYGREYLYLIKEYGTDIDVDFQEDHMQEFVYNIGKTLGLTDREAPDEYVILDHGEPQDVAFLTANKVYNAYINETTHSLVTDNLGDFYRARRLFKDKK